MVRVAITSVRRSALGARRFVFHLASFLVSEPPSPCPSPLLTAQHLAHLTPLWFIHPSLPYSFLFHLHPSSLDHLPPVSWLLSLFSYPNNTFPPFFLIFNAVSLYITSRFSEPPYQIREVHPANRCTMELFLQVTPSGPGKRLGRQREHD